MTAVRMFSIKNPSGYVIDVLIRYILGITTIRKRRPAKVHALFVEVPSRLLEITENTIAAASEKTIGLNQKSIITGSFALRIPPIWKISKGATIETINEQMSDMTKNEIPASMVPATILLKFIIKVF